MRISHKRDREKESAVPHYNTSGFAASDYSVAVLHNVSCLSGMGTVKRHIK